MKKYKNIEGIDFSVLSKGELLFLRDLVNGRIQEIDTEVSKDKVVLPQADIDMMNLCRENRSAVTSCPHCGSVSYIRNGTKNGRQRYLCKDCRRTFGDYHGTILYHSKLSVEQWKDLLTHIFQKESVRWIRKETKLNPKTILYNRHRVSEIIKFLEENQDDFPSVAECDEYYMPLTFKDIKSPEFFIKVLERLPYSSMNRKEREEYVTVAGVALDTLEEFKKYNKEKNEYLKEYFEESDLSSVTRLSNAINEMDKATAQIVLKLIEGEQKKKRGISNQQVCISSCIDHSQNKFIQPVCLGRIEPKHIENSVCKHFTEGTILVTDSLRAYRTVANKQGIPLWQIPSGRHSSGNFNLALINSYHSEIKTFMDHFSKSVSSKYIDNYMALFYWTQKHKKDTVAEMVDNFIGIMARQSRKTKLHEFKYSDLPFDTKTLKTAHRDYWSAVRIHDEEMIAERTARRNANLQRKKLEREQKNLAQGQSK